MPKTKTNFVCQECGSAFTKWQGQCTGCHAWNSIQEETMEDGRTGNYAGAKAELTALKDVAIKEKPRLATGLSEFDHVLGGGLVADSVVLIGGDPGIGKSTIMIQVLSHMAKHFATLYVTGEESLEQVAMRANRLDLKADKVMMLAETQVERIIKAAKAHKPKFIVIDSIQTIYSEEVQSAPGSVSQVRESAARLVRYAKQTGTALLIAGHVTKEGAIAGPRVLEHMVDTVLYFEGRSDSRFRVVRAVKNRFGAVNELGVFAMTEKGLKEVSNPSAIFLSGNTEPAAGSCIMVTWEGSRPLLVEVQALVDESHLANPRRVTVGLEQNRLSMLLAVLNRHGGVATYDQDVFVNVVGGLRVLETAVDLAVLVSVMSSLRNRILKSGLVIFGEVGLSGEVRPVPSGLERIREAQKHGFTTVIVPKGNKPAQKVAGINVIAVENVEAALAAAM